MCCSLDGVEGGAGWAAVSADVCHGHLAVFKASFCLFFSAPLSRGVPGEGLNGRLLWKIEGFGPAPASYYPRGLMFLFFVRP